MYSVNGTTIKLTRGDTLNVTLSLKRGNSSYTPVAGDSIRFAMKHRQMNPQKSAYTDSVPLIVKDIPIDTMALKLEPEDTKSLAFDKYVYDISITFADGDVDTFITESVLEILPEVD